MKKRSLFAAVAMLLVSAIVLTGSTYAWFIQSASKNEVDTITAEITSGDANLKLLPTTNKAETDPVWEDSLDEDDFILTDTFNPVSMNRSTGDPSFVKVAYDGTYFTSGGSVATANSTSGGTTTKADIVRYGFKVRLTNGSTVSGKTIKMTPTFTRNDGAFQYALVKVSVGSTDTYYLYGTGTGYTPVTGISGSWADTKTGTGAIVAILDTTDTLASDSTTTFTSLGSPIAANATSGDDITLFTNATADNDGVEKNYEADVEVWMWAEGNDPECVPGAVSTASASLKFGFTSITVDNTTP